MININRREREYMEYLKETFKDDPVKLKKRIDDFASIILADIAGRLASKWSQRNDGYWKQVHESLINDKESRDRANRWYDKEYNQCLKNLRVM